MPLYESYCKDCRAKFELLTTYVESDVDVECARCHGANVRKLLSVFARPSRGGDGDDFGDFSGGDYGDDGGDDFGGGGCSCGGACGCNN